MRFFGLGCTRIKNKTIIPSNKPNKERTVPKASIISPAINYKKVPTYQTVPHQEDTICNCFQL